jgi:hypothetical protein
MVSKELRDMGWVGRRTYRSDRDDVREAGGGGQDGGAAKAVANKQRRCFLVFGQPLCGGNQIVDARGEVGCRKISSLSPNPVKSKRRTPTPREASADAMVCAAGRLFPQVKQCAKTAQARASPAGLSMTPESI